MANPEHLEILYQGVEKWNQWRKENPNIKPDLSEAVLFGRSFSGADFSFAELFRVTFFAASLDKANFLSANLVEATLVNADLRGADFFRANLAAACLHGADFNGAEIGFTIFVDSDLGDAIGLDNVFHLNRSSIGIDTIYLSKGKIPEAFLRGCGAPENFITYAKSLVGQPIEFYSCFISYSSMNQDFAERLCADLLSKGVRCWFSPEDLKIGDRFRVTIDESIRKHDKLLLILSEDSVESQWVEKEVETAMEREREQGRDSVVLFPIKLDDAILDKKSGWAADIRRTRHIGDFRGWKNHDEYRKAFDRLLRALSPAAVIK
jgi:TIR domain-containing protein/pentapeptide repeat protein